MFSDAYDLPVTCASETALTSYNAGVESSLRFDQSGIGELRVAIAADQNFALAHAVLGRQLFVHGFHGQANEHIAIALSLTDSVTPRERDAIEVAAAVFATGTNAIGQAKAHVALHPTDIFILAHLVGPFGLIAFSGSPDWHAENVALLESTRPFYAEDNWWQLSARAFFGAELGELTQAREDAERAWSISQNGNCAHSLAHLHFEAGALEEGREFLNEWAANQGAKSNMLHHLIWHLSLLEIECGVDANQIMQRFDEDLDPRINNPTPLETLCDNASFLWRCFLAGVDVPTIIREASRRFGEENFPKRGFSFADMHVALTTALHPERKYHREFVRQLASEYAATDAAKNVQEFARGLELFVENEYALSAAVLEVAMDGAVRIGGSNPQRRIIEDTCIEACIRGGLFEKAASMVRTRRRAYSRADQNLLDRVEVNAINN